MWVTMNQHYPQPDTPETLEGTAAHWVNTQVIANTPVAEGMAAPNGVIVTAEMLDGAELLCDVLTKRLAGMPPLHTEERLHIPSVHADCWGTPDHWSASLRTIELIDYKFGHKFVDEFENDQCVTYTAGIIDDLARVTGHGAGLLDQHLTVNITIVQPRCYYRGRPVRTWTVQASHLRPQVNDLRAAAADALGRKPPTATTNDACDNCPGRHVCPALQRSGYQSAELSEQSTPVELQPAAASLELRMLERALARLEARVDGLRESVTASIRAGATVPFHRVEHAAGRAQWTKPIPDVIALGDVMGVTLAKPGVITPNQARKLGIDEAVISAYSATNSGAAKLVSVTDSDARRVFANNP